MDLASILTQIDDVLYTWLLIYLLAGSGIYFSVRTRFVQVRRFKDALHCMMEKREGDKGVSSFQALMIATASRVGTGNMAGVATAIILGGPGAAFWMWLMAVLGSASAFIESTLAQIYKKREGDSFKGGPAYYIERALGSRPLGIVFAISLIATFAFGFNGLQAYNIVSAFAVYTTNLESSILPTAIGIILAIAAFYIFFAGDVIGKISSVLVPAMAALYIAIGVFVIVIVCLFAFTSIIGNYFYAEANILFITKNKVVMNIFRAAAALMVFIGAGNSLDVAWSLADITMGLEAVVNIIAIVLLGNIAFKALDDYESQMAKGLDPVFHESNIGLTNTDVWKD